MKITHAFIVKRTADDIRAVIEIMNKRLQEVESGDLDAASGLFMEEMTGWPEMLALRLDYIQSHKDEEMPDATAKPGDAAKEAT